jgi:tripartite-type tricarboxylate transporter receptor subunit TctC
MATGIRGVHVPYRGAAPALQDLVSGAIDVAFVTAGAVLPQVRTGALRPLAVSAGERSADLPDVPTAQEAGVKDFEARTGNYLLAPAALDDQRLAFMGAQVEAVMKDAAVQEQLKKLAIEPVFTDAAGARKALAADHEKWGAVLKAAGVKANP